MVRPFLFTLTCASPFSVSDILASAKLPFSKQHRNTYIEKKTGNLLNKRNIRRHRLQKRNSGNNSSRRNSNHNQICRTRPRSRASTPPMFLFLLGEHKFCGLSQSYRHSDLTCVYISTTWKKSIKIHHFFCEEQNQYNTNKIFDVSHFVKHQ